MSRLLWRMPVWVHTLMHRLTGWMPTIELPTEVIAQARTERDGGQINWRDYESQATGFRLMRFPR